MVLVDLANEKVYTNKAGKKAAELYQRVLEMIDEALQRIEDSEYGVCLDCGAIIPKERLEAKPYARYCTKCKSKREEMEDSRYHR